MGDKNKNIKREINQTMARVEKYIAARAEHDGDVREAKDAQKRADARVKKLLKGK